MTKINERKSTIENRIINSNGGYRLDIYGSNAYLLDKYFGYETNKKGKWCFKSTLENGSTIRSINKTLYKGFVYNLGVEDDNSYVIHDMIVHNCGEWGSPSSSAFRLEKIYDAFIEIPEYRTNYLVVKTIEDYSKKIEYPPRDYSKYSSYVMGIDAGYTTNSPCAVTVFGEKVTEDSVDYHLVYRGLIAGESTVIASYINTLITYFDCRLVGMDGQGYGESTYSMLINDKLFPKTYDYNKKVVKKFISDQPIILETIETKTGKQFVKDTRKCNATEAMNKCFDRVGLLFPRSELRTEGRQKEVKPLLEAIQSETARPLINRIGRYAYDNAVDSHTIDSIRFLFMAIHDDTFQCIEEIKRKRLLLPLSKKLPKIFGGK
jgi:hypothetical protein